MLLEVEKQRRLRLLLGGGEAERDGDVVGSGKAEKAPAVVRERKGRKGWDCCWMCNGIGGWAVAEGGKAENVHAVVGGGVGLLVDVYS